MEIELVKAADLVKRAEINLRERSDTFEERFPGCELGLTRDYIEFENGYWIDLNRIKTTDQFVDWLYQLWEKTWITRVQIAGFIEGFDLWCEVNHGTTARGYLNCYEAMLREG